MGSKGWRTVEIVRSAHDAGYFEWALRMFPLNCPPATWVAYMRRDRDADLSLVLPSILLPTVVLVRPAFRGREIDVAGDSGLLFDDIGQHGLKGLPDGLALYRVLGG